ncbi:MAG TPA: hypothetical protein VJS18_21160 [Paraburkholderia sp.]|nr:hypothetical protein [Paraburkholderia sp.]
MTAADHNVRTLTSRVQWGRSFNLTVPNVAQRTRVASVQLPRAMDVSIYLEGQLTESSATWLTYQVSVGSGGISVFNGTVPAPAVGVVRHFVANTVDVDANIRAITTPAGAHVRVAGCVGLGRPSLIYEPGVIITTLGPGAPTTGLKDFYNPGSVAVGWTHVDAADRRVFLVPPWTTRMKVAVNNVSGGVAADQIVDEYTAAGTFRHRSSAAEFADFRALDPQTWLVILDAGAGISWEALVQFEKIT